jgi:H+/Cl- antiporter ClcA
MAELSVLFLQGIEHLSLLRESYPWMVFFAPLVGLLTGFTYFVWLPRLSKADVSDQVELGEVLREQKPPTALSQSMAPLILAFTWLSHLAGLSIGREGTAIQMGGGVGLSVSRFYRFSETASLRFILVGVACGFAGVFGTPFAASVFALEWSRRFRRDRLLQSIGETFLVGATAFATHAVALNLGARHLSFPQDIAESVNVLLSGASLSPTRLLGSYFLLSIDLIIASCLFIFISRAFSKVFSSWISARYRPAALGLFLAVVFYKPVFRPFSGLGTNIISLSFTETINWKTPVLKLLLTSLSTSAGFKGGDVTPLFSVGSAIGNVIAGVFHLQYAPFAAMGMVAMFAGVHSVPLAAAAMAFELFGWKIGIGALLLSLIVSSSVRRLTRRM